MASILSSKANQFRYATRILCSHLLSYGRPTKLSPTFSHHHHLSSHPRLVRNQGYGNGCLVFCQRLLSSTAATNVNQEKPAPDNSAKDDSGQGKESGSEQDQKSDAGKSICGSPISWLSFLLLVVTGAGLVFYYDREKKQHIEEEKAGIEIVPVFISVDPERDTVEQVHEYVKVFHPKLIGLTGTSDEIKSVARAYHVYYMKMVEEDSDYLVDHSLVMYLMGPDMEFVKFFGKNNDVDSLANGVIKEEKQYKK